MRSVCLSSAWLDESSAAFENRSERRVTRTGIGLILLRPLHRPLASGDPPMGTAIVTWSEADWHRTAFRSPIVLLLIRVIDEKTSCSVVDSPAVTTRAALEEVVQSVGHYRRGCQRQTGDSARQSYSRTWTEVDGVHSLLWMKWSVMYVLCTFVTLRESGVHPLPMAS